MTSLTAFELWCRREGRSPRDDWSFVCWQWERQQERPGAAAGVAGREPVGASAR